MLSDQGLDLLWRHNRDLPAIHRLRRRCRDSVAKPGKAFPNSTGVDLTGARTVAGIGATRGPRGRGSGRATLTLWLLSLANELGGIVVIADVTVALRGEIAKDGVAVDGSLDRLSIGIYGAALARAGGDVRARARTGSESCVAPCPLTRGAAVVFPGLVGALHRDASYARARVVSIEQPPCIVLQP